MLLLDHSTTRPLFKFGVTSHNQVETVGHHDLGRRVTATMTPRKTVLPGGPGLAGEPTRDGGRESHPTRSSVHSSFSLEVSLPVSESFSDHGYCAHTVTAPTLSARQAARACPSGPARRTPGGPDPWPAAMAAAS
jgi:hypothetical protein